MEAKACLASPMGYKDTAGQRGKAESEENENKSRANERFEQASERKARHEAHKAVCSERNNGMKQGRMGDA